MGIDFDVLNSALNSSVESLLFSWLPGGKMVGREFVAGSINGEPGQSFKFNIDKCIGSDFATGQKFGDLIDVYAGAKRLTIGEAAKELGEMVLPKPSITEAPETNLIPPGPNTKGPRLREASWCYRSPAGDVLFYVERIDRPDGKKEFKPHSFNGKKWVNKIWPKPRPLYGLDLLRPGPVLVVEGEKTCDAARIIVGDNYSVVTWSGGASAPLKSDWSVLAGRDVLLWPDNDTAGQKAMATIGKTIGKIAASYKYLDVSSLAPKADAADLNWTYDQFLSFVKPKSVQIVEDKTNVNASYISKSTMESILPHWNWSKETNGRDSERTTPKPSLENFEALLKYLGVVVRYNIISKQEEILIPGTGFSIDNEGVASVAWLKSVQAQISMPTFYLLDYLTHIADKNYYNPVAVWIESTPWDGISRLENLYATIVAKDEAINEVVMNLKKTLIRRWLVSAIAGAFSPRGVSAHGVLVLQGNQYIGKTAWVKSLAPKDLDIIADGRILRPEDKDSVNQIVRYWIVELGELDATFRRSDIAQLKAFLTKDSDIFRRAFAPKDSRFARRTVFFASVNPSQFLHDETGNRRFWTIECDSINHAHGLDMQQIWAEVHALYVAGESWFLTADEMAKLNEHNESFMVSDPTEERVGSGLNWIADKVLWRWSTATDILGLLNIDHPTPSQVKKASQEILKRNGGQKKRSNSARLLYHPPKNSWL